jgi:hypothetical protein
MSSQRRPKDRQEGREGVRRVASLAAYHSICPKLHWLLKRYGEGAQNFLKSTEPLAKNIITNPPYGTHGL